MFINTRRVLQERENNHLMSLLQTLYFQRDYFFEDNFEIIIEKRWNEERSFHLDCVLSNLLQRRVRRLCLRLGWNATISGHKALV